MENPTNMNSPYSSCISSYNNLPYLKLAIESVRLHSHYNDCPLIIHAENCTDGTNEWLEKNSSKYALEYYIETNPSPRGIGGGMNFCADKVKTEFINFLHADFYVSKNYDLELLKFFEKYPHQRMWVFSARIQPNLFNDAPRPGTLPVPPASFGEYHHNFNAEKFLVFSEEYKNNNDIEITKTEGVSGLIRKCDWDYIGGNDPRFAPAYWEDADLFIRMANEGFKFVLTSNSVVYHFGSRASRFPDDNLNHRPLHLEEIEKRSFYRFIEKYGRIPERDENDFYIPIPIIDGSPTRIPLA
jgi:GT2 family glycosyltransferase